MRIAKIALGLAVLGSLLFGASAFGATAPAGGLIKVWVTLSGTGSGPVVITGAIGDYGKTINVNSAGKIEKKGNYSDLVLKKGTILLNTTQANAAFNNVNPADFNAATCSASLMATTSVPIVSGTKAYVGITGSLTVTETFAFVGPFTKSGKCNVASSSNPSAIWATVTGSGTVSFS